MNRLSGKTASLLARRKNVSPGNQTLTYNNPLHFVRGRDHFLYDVDGTEYLDAYNNVPHVGHANPVIVEAVSRQLSELNTNTRYLQEAHITYAERLLSLLPSSLSKIVFLNSASEANELALRLVRAATGAHDMVVMDHGYHGGTTGAMAVSPYKFNHQKSLNRQEDWVHTVLQPDCYRGGFRGPGAADQYVKNVKSTLAGLKDAGRKLAGFICECAPSVGGQIILPNGYLREVYQMIRSAGGLCIADDVQTGLGRLGSHFWGFEQQQAVPDIAVFGKPLGNGYPLAAVAMTEEVADAFAEGPEFFSTFGGSSGACAAGNAVLDVLASEHLSEHAAAIGDDLRASFQRLARDHEILGEVRGSGFFIGLDLVTNRDTRTAAIVQADFIKNRLADERVLIGVEGPEDNVLKIRPPMTFNSKAADRLLEAFSKVLSEPEAQA